MSILFRKDKRYVKVLCEVGIRALFSFSTFLPYLCLMKKVQQFVSLIGPNASTCTPEIYAFGEKLGQGLADAGFRIVCGGMGGFMEAVCKGAHASWNYVFGTTIGILPGLDREGVNEWVDISIPTGIGIARNQVVVNTGNYVVAVGGGAGTLSEIAFAWQLKKPVLCVTGLVPGDGR